MVFYNILFYFCFWWNVTLNGWITLLIFNANHWKISRMNVSVRFMLYTWTFLHFWVWNRFMLLMNSTSVVQRILLSVSNLSEIFVSAWLIKYKSDTIFPLAQNLILCHWLNYLTEWASNYASETKETCIGAFQAGPAV